MVEEDTEFVTFDGDTITKSDIRDEIINKYITANYNGLTKITDFTIGSEAYHLADVMASYILEHRELIDLNYRMSMIHTAEGEFLDNFGDMVGVHRYGSSPSVGSVVFTRLGEDTSVPIVIPDGSQVATVDAISFIVDNDGEDLVLDVGATTVQATVLCELDGAYTNVLPNTVVLVMGDLGNLVSVTNHLAFSEGDDIETDDDYRNRILQAPFEVPVGSLAWYEQVANELDLIHDVKVEKGATSLEADILMYYNPIDWTDTQSAEEALDELFSMKEYDIAGVTLDYILADKVVVLPDESSDGTYYFGVSLMTNYSLDMVKENIINKIIEYNDTALISVEFNPGTLASLIENEVEGVENCHIVLENSGSYTEILEPESMNDTQVFQVDTSNLDDRIVELRFNVDIEVVP